MTSATSNLQSRIQAYLNAVVARLQAANRPDLVAGLKEAVEARRSVTPSVVVVGESGRGKSSLINALVGRNVSPVDVDVTTGCNLVFHYSPQTQVNVRFGKADGSRPVEQLLEIAVDEVEEWATVDGNPGNEKGVQAVLVGLENPLLQRMTIVDTPGVGGLDAGHGALAAATAAAADALVLVLDANAPVSGPELEFLSQVAEKVDNVTLALTKTDIHAGWRVIANDATTKIGQRVPRLKGAPLFPVSPSRAIRTADREKWGITALGSHLERNVAERADVLRYANILRVADTCLSELWRTLAASSSVLAGGSGALAALEAERRRLETMHADARSLMRELDNGLRRLTLHRGDALNRSVRELRISYDERASKVTRQGLETLPGQLLSDVTALADRLTEETHEGLTGLVEDLIRRIDDTAPELISLEQLYSADLADVVHLDTPRKRAANRVERLSTLISFSSGRSIGSLVASLPMFALGGPIFAVAGLGVGALFAFHMHKGRSDVNQQTEFRNWMREQLAEAERQLSNDFSRAMLDIGDELRTLLTERIDTRRSETAQAIRTCEAQLAQARDARDRDQLTAEQQLQEVRDLKVRGAELRAGLLSQASPSSAVPELVR